MDDRDRGRSWNAAGEVIVNRLLIIDDRPRFFELVGRSPRCGFIANAAKKKTPIGALSSTAEVRCRLAGARWNRQPCHEVGVRLGRHDTRLIVSKGLECEFWELQRCFLMASGSM